MKDDNLAVGDELIWKDGSRSVVLALNEKTFHELTQYGWVSEQCYPDVAGYIGYQRSGRNFSEIADVIRAMQTGGKS